MDQKQINDKIVQSNNKSNNLLEDLKNKIKNQKKEIKNIKFSKDAPFELELISKEEGEYNIINKSQKEFNFKIIKKVEFNFQVKITFENNKLKLNGIKNGIILLEKEQTDIKIINEKNEEDKIIVKLYWELDKKYSKKPFNYDENKVFKRELKIKFEDDDDEGKPQFTSIEPEEGYLGDNVVNAKFIGTNLLKVNSSLILENEDSIIRVIETSGSERKNSEIIGTFFIPDNAKIGEYKIKYTYSEVSKSIEDQSNVTFEVKKKEYDDGESKIKITVKIIDNSTHIYVNGNNFTNNIQFISINDHSGKVIYNGKPFFELIRPTQFNIIINNFILPKGKYVLKIKINGEEFDLNFNNDDDKPALLKNQDFEIIPVTYRNLGYFFKGLEKNNKENLKHYPNESEGKIRGYRKYRYIKFSKDKTYKAKFELSKALNNNLNLDLNIVLIAEKYIISKTDGSESLKKEFIRFSEKNHDHLFKSINFEFFDKEKFNYDILKNNNFKRNNLIIPKRKKLICSFEFNNDGENVLRYFIGIKANYKGFIHSAFFVLTNDEFDLEIKSDKSKEYLTESEKIIEILENEINKIEVLINGLNHNYMNFKNVKNHKTIIKKLTEIKTSLGKEWSNLKSLFSSTPTIILNELIKKNKENEDMSKLLTWFKETREIFEKNSKTNPIIIINKYCNNLEKILKEEKSYTKYKKPEIKKLDEKLKNDFKYIVDHLKKVNNKIKKIVENKS